MKLARLHVYGLVGLALAVCVTGAHAQMVQTIMRGNTVVADPSVTTAWLYNPAALASLAGLEAEFPAVPGESGWRHAASADLELSGDTDLFALNWGGVKAGKSFGLGAGYLDLCDNSYLGAGFGKSWSKKGISWGLTWKNWDLPSGDSENIFDLGMIMESPREAGSSVSALKYGLVLRDVTDEIAHIWDIGVVANLDSGVKIAADLSDLTDEIDRQFRIGATKRFGAKKTWEAGIGFDDGDLTLGAMYDSSTDWKGGSWKFGAAWQNMDEGKDSLIIGAFGNWGL